MFKIYESKSYKLLMIVPIILFITSFYFSTQVKQGIDFKGGTLIQINGVSNFSEEQIKTQLEDNFDLEDLEVRAIGGASNGLYIEFLGEKNLLKAQELIEKAKYNQAIEICKKLAGDVKINSTDLKVQADSYFSKARQNFKDNLTSFLSSKTGVKKTGFTVQEMGSSLGESFLNQARNAIIFAFILIAAVILYYFRRPLISFAIVQSAFFDVFVAYSSLGFFNIPLSLATIGPLLMLIGYSVDTDIMLTDRLLTRKQGTIHERLNGAIKTGVTMTLTSLFALLSITLISYYYSITIMFEISLILGVGRAADLIATWFTNAVLILWDVERFSK